MKVLILSDSPFADSGFGRVAREIGMYLWNLGHDVVGVSWAHVEATKIIPYAVHYGGGHDDMYCRKSFPGMCEREQPDVVLAIGDTWMIAHAAFMSRRFKVVGYVPIDAAPISLQHAKVLRALDTCVVYTEFARHAVHECDPALSVQVIPHGVDRDVFHPAQDRNAIRTALGWTDQVVIGCVARNNPRKNLPALIRAFSDFRANHDAILYMHTCPKDPIGHDLYEICRHYDVQDYVQFPSNMEPAAGVQDTHLAMLYGAMDLFVLPTMAEGWGLPILEAMSCGTPVLVTNYGGHVEYVHDACPLIGVGAYIHDPLTGARHAIVDDGDMLAKMDQFFMDRRTWINHWMGGSDVNDVNDFLTPSYRFGAELRQKCREAGLQVAAKYEWKKVLELWLPIIGTAVSRDTSSHLSMEVVI